MWTARPASVSVAVAVILTVGAGLRFWHLGQSPPGLNQDEAMNAWNARCLLKTGMDEAGRRWPIFYFTTTGQNPTPLYAYLVIPTQAMLGMSVVSSRLPAAVIGVATIGLTFLVGRRLFGDAAGLVAAAVLAISPWHVQQSRWGHEAAITPFLVLLPVALALAAKLPLDGVVRRPRVGVALLAGLMGGVCCYGYYAVRLFMPLLAIAAIAVSPRAWREFARSSDGRRGLAAAALGFAVTFGPLVWTHLFDPEISRRGAQTHVWAPDDGWMTRARKMATRYPGHFGLDFLFVNGDHFPIQSTGGGNFPLIVAPLMLAGAAVCLRDWRTSGALRFLAVWLLLYPIADCIGRHQSMHALRSLPGLPALALLAGVGAVGIYDGLARIGRGLATAMAWLGIGVGIVSLALFCRRFFDKYDREPAIYYSYHTDYLEALDWLKPRLGEYDAVISTTKFVNMGQLISTVGLDYEPARWFAEPREYHDRAGWQVCDRFGKVYFNYDGSADKVVAALRAEGRRKKVLFIARPYEYTPGREVLRIIDPEGKAALVLLEEQL